MDDFTVSTSGAIAASAETTHRPRLRLYRKLGKRVFDLSLAIVSLPVILPVLFVLWCLVRRDGGPGFYSQVRVGRDGREFECLKLRSMVINAEDVLREMCELDPELAAEWHLNQKLSNDPRITKIGRLLRATSLDELPQIFNILRGDMSFVGPRPFMPDQSKLYDDAGGRAYYTVRPGITGPWQVFGRSSTTFTDRVKYDGFYCRNLSFRQDLFLIWKTAGVVLRRTGT